MARIDINRRAEIGRARRERTRQVLLNAAKRVFAASPIEELTVDDIVAEAGLGKGTFYYYFRDFDALITALGEELATEFDELQQTQRIIWQHPLERLAWTQLAFFRRAEIEPHWGRIVRHARLTDDSAAASVHAHLAADLEDARRIGALTRMPTAFAVSLEVAMGFAFLEAGRTGSERTLTAEAMMEAILRALGVAEGEAATIVARVAVVPPVEKPG